MKNTIKNLVIGLLIGLFLFISTYTLAGLTSPSGGGSPVTPSAMCKVDGDTWILCNSSDTFGDATNPINAIDVNSLIVNTSFILPGTVGVGGINMDGEIITNIGNAGTDFTAIGGLVLADDLTITGDDLIMNTNTSGAVLVADGTNFNPVVMSGNASIGTDGAVTVSDITCTNCINATEIEDIYVLNSGDTVEGLLAVTVTNAGILDTQLKLQNSSNTVGTGARASFGMLDSNSAITTYGRISTEIDVNTAGSEDGTMRLSVIGGGAFDDLLIMDGSSKLASFAGGITTAGNLTITKSDDLSTLTTIQNTDTAIGTAGYLLELIHDSNDDTNADFLICQDDGAGTPDTVFSIASDGAIYIGASGNSLFNESVSVGSGSASVVDLGANAEADIYITDDLEVDGTIYTASDSIVIEATQTPASNAACTTGEIAWDANYIYICTASGVWKRSQITGGY